MHVGLRFDYESGGSKVAAKYMRPSLPEKWYLQPLADDERDRVIKSQKDAGEETPSCRRPSLRRRPRFFEFAKHEVNIGSIKSSVAHPTRRRGFDKIGAAMTYALSWDR